MNRRSLAMFAAVVTAAALVAATVSLTHGQAEPGRPGGMMRGDSYGRMWSPGPAGRGFGPGGMMGGSWQPGPSAQPLTSFSDAEQAFQGYVSATGNPDLRLDEIMQFQFNYYAIVREQSTHQGAFELLADPATGVVVPEFGPTMMWNTKYGHMGWWWSQQPGEPSVDRGQARRIAQHWLDQSQSGSTTVTVDVFPGYYTVDVLNDRVISGMLSINAYTGQVWPHTWHGAFVASAPS